MNWVFSLYTGFRDKWKLHLQKMEQIHILLQAYKYRPSSRRDLRTPRRKWKQPEQAIIYNPWKDDDDSVIFEK
jgi:hypothetical protein